DLPSRRRRSVSALAALAVSALMASQICAPGLESGIGSTTGTGLFRCVSASATAACVPPPVPAFFVGDGPGTGGGPAVAPFFSGLGGGGRRVGEMFRGAAETETVP